MSVTVGYVTNNGDIIWSRDFDGHGAFRDGMYYLEKFALGLVEVANDSEFDAFSTLLADIRDITQDSGIMDDPDQWEDMEFDAPNGQYYIEF